MFLLKLKSWSIRRRILVSSVVLLCLCIIIFWTEISTSVHFKSCLFDDQLCAIKRKNVPDFALYLRMYSGKKNLYESVLVQSMRYFWTLNLPLIIVLDKTPQDKAFGKEIKEKFPRPLVYYEEPIPSMYYHNWGHTLQQLSMFHAEDHCSATFVGFVDTDTMFTTMVTPEQLFENEKPIIIGEAGDEEKYYKVWTTAANITKFALGKREVFKCMAYFPMIMKVQHIIEMREYMTKLHKKDNFNMVFKNFAKNPAISQFNIMCNYVWYFHRDEYVFRIQFKKTKGKSNLVPKSRESAQYYTKNVGPELRYPIPRASVHYSYFPAHKKQSTFRNIIRAGLCYSGGFDVCSSLCKPYKRDELNKILFKFEMYDWSWDPRCLDAQKKYLKDLRRMNSTMGTEIKKRILLGCREVNKLLYKP